MPKTGPNTALGNYQTRLERLYYVARSLNSSKAHIWLFMVSGQLFVSPWELFLWVWSAHSTSAWTFCCGHWKDSWLWWAQHWFTIYHLCVINSVETHVIIYIYIYHFGQSLLVLLVLSREPGELQEGEKKPKAHKLVEGLAILYLLVHMWSGYIVRFFWCQYFSSLCNNYVDTH